MKISDAVVIAMIVAVPPTITALASLIVSVKTQGKVEKIREQTNHITEQLVASTRSDALKEGNAQGAKEQKKKDEPGLTTNVMGK